MIGEILAFSTRFTPGFIKYDRQVNEFFTDPKIEAQSKLKVMGKPYTSRRHTI